MKGFEDFLRDTQMDGNSPLLISEPPMQFLPTLASVLSEDCAIFLQQLRYWLNRSNNIFDDRRWVYNSIEQWHLQFFWMSESSLKRVIQKLKTFDYDGNIYHIIETRNHNADRMNHRLFYSINEAELQKLALISRFERIVSMQAIVRESPHLSECWKNGKLPLDVMKYLDYDIEDLRKNLQEFLNREDEETGQKLRLGQNDPIGESPENFRLGQNEPIGKTPIYSDKVKMNQSIGSKWSNPSGQNEPIDQVKMNFPTNKQKNTDADTTTSELSLKKAGEAAKTGVPSSDVPASLQEKRERQERMQGLKDLLKQAGISLAITPRMLGMLLDQYPDAVLQLAIQKAEGNHARSLNYVRTILEQEDFSIGKGKSNENVQPHGTPGNHNEGSDAGHTMSDIERYAKEADEFYAQFGL